MEEITGVITVFSLIPKDMVIKIKKTIIEFLIMRFFTFIVQ
jgi:hypothetical protein